MTNSITGSYSANQNNITTDKSRLHTIPPRPQEQGQWVFVPKGCAVLVTPIPADDQ